MYVFDLLGRTSIFSTRSYPKGSILIGPMAEVVVVLQIRRSRNNLRSSITELGHSALQKGLAFGRDWSGTVGQIGAPRVLRDPAPPALSPLRGFGGAA
jgi:hypothetical protein